MHEYPSGEHALIEELLKALRDLPDGHAELAEATRTSDGYQLDAQVQLSLAGKSIALLVEAKKTLHPRDAREALWKLRGAHPSTNPDCLYMLIAESISSGAREFLRKERVGYFASGGSLYLPAEGAYVFVDAPPIKSATRSMRSLFAGRRAQVLHTLLADPDRWFGINEIAKQSHAAASTTSGVVHQLERNEWLECRGRGPNKERHLREPGALLDAWRTHLESSRLPTPSRYYVSGLQNDDLMQQLGRIATEYRLQYAVSFESAAQRYAPFLSAVAKVKVWLQPNANNEEAMAALDARPVDEGANLVVFESKSHAELQSRREERGVWLANPIQVYLDLSRSEGRSREMADHLRQERIGF